MSIERIAIDLFVRLATDKKVQEEAYNVGITCFHKMQVMTGNVNRHSVEQATKLAIGSCLRKDLESQARVAAFITALYLQYEDEIERAAQVGGSLLKRFGKSWFPHIKDRELRFALRVDAELEDYLYDRILKS